MSTATATTADRATSGGSHAWRAVLRAELRLFRREPAALFWILCFPPLLLVILGSIPSFRTTDADLGGVRLVDAYVPVSVLMSMIFAGLQSMPPVITGYRERGILRRMSTTPVRPGALLGTQMGVHGVAALASSVLSLVVGRLAFDVALPRQAFGYALGLVLAVLTALAMGAVVAARARTSKIASAIGSVVFFPMMFCAGLWLPVRAMPDTLARVVQLTPFGAAAQALDQAAAGDWPEWTRLVVLVLWAVALSVAASRWFRWE